MTTANPIEPLKALLHPVMPGVYMRQMIYDPTWTDPAYNAYKGQLIVPAPGSLVQDTDLTQLWVISTDPVTAVPTYQPVNDSSLSDSVTSLLDYGNTVFRLYVDNRALPYPATPDAKCIFIGKSPRFYTLTRYPGTAQQTVISQYYDATGKLVSQQVPLVAQTSDNTSWYMPRCALTTLLDDNEEIEAKIFDESGTEVFSAKLFAKASAIINEAAIYSPTIVGMTVTANQTSTDGSFFLYEKQDFSSLGLTVNLVYDNGTTAIVPLDGIKCILYGQSDFISSFAGLAQTMTVKYFRSVSEAITPSLADATGQMISKQITVKVIPNKLATTVKIVPIPVYNTASGLYVMYYWMMFADGRSHVDITPYATIKSGTLATDASHYGVAQSYILSVDMSKVDPVTYPTTSLYQQSIVITFGAPNTLVRYSFRDSMTSPYIYGLDNSSSRRPSIRYDATRKQYFIPSSIFVNQAAFINSFYTQAAPPYDPTVSAIPQQPTHFTIRDRLTGNMVIAAPIPIASYSQAFTILNDTTGLYLKATLMVEFLNVINGTTTNVLWASPVDVSVGSYTS